MSGDDLSTRDPLEARRLGVLRAWMRRRRLGEARGFGLRLLASGLVVMVAVGGLGWMFVSRALYRSQVRTEAAASRADAKGFEQIGRASPNLKVAIREIDEVMDAVGRRPGAIEVLLIDQRKVVRAASDDRLVGKRDSHPRIDAALRGTEYAGHEVASGADQRDFEFLMPITVLGSRYAYELTLDDAAFNAQLADLRMTLIVIGGLMIFGGGGAFYLVGGRSLMRSHRYALQRATRDGLTELPNQRAFHDELPQAVTTAARYQDSLALAVFDVDDFKHVNDRYGHSHGDQVLKRLAAVLREGRAGDRAFRIGGDEFAALLPRTNADGSRVLGRRFMRAIEEAGLKVSIGISALRPGESVDVLQAEADAALYEAKRRGGAQIVYFEDVQGQVVVTSPDKKDAIRDMIERRALTTVFQPIWDLESGSLLGLEALSRPDPIYGLAGPAEAYDIAEQIGRVHDLDVVCIHDALAHIAEIPDATLLFLNVHPQTLDIDADRDQWLTQAVHQVGQPPEQTVIEVTERFGGRAAAIAKCLKLLRQNGFKLALDDVGTGNSGLEMLRAIQAEYVKIDGGIVAAAATDPNARAVLMAMATYARQTGAYVIAEGIEDEDSLSFLRHLNTSQLTQSRIIQGGQGFTLGRPEPVIQTRTPSTLHAHLAAA